MLHHLKLTARRLLRHKSFSLINVLGLSIGIAACLLIYLYVHNELTYDGYNQKKDRIARVTATFSSPESNTVLAITPTPLAGTLVRDFPELESAVRIQPAELIFRQQNQPLKEADLCYTEPSIFSIFTFTFLEGSADRALAAPGSIVLTRSFEKKYFGKARGLGQTLTCAGKTYKVTAVVDDRPANSDIPIRALLYKDFSKTTEWVGDGFDVYTFVLFHGKPDLPHFNARLPQVAAKYVQPQLDAAGAKGYRISFEMEMLKDLHFSQGKMEDTPKGNRSFNTIFSALAVFILLLALLNYINLSTTKAMERAKEVGVRKIVGARPFQLMRQFLGESGFLIAIAWLVAIGLVSAGIPVFNRTLDTHLAIKGWGTVIFLLLLFPLVVIGGGLYPAFVLSRFQPVKVLKGRFTGKGKGFSLRKVLTVVQFVIALFMLAGTAIIHQQMSYIAHKDLGADRSQVVSINFPNVGQVQLEGGNDSLLRIRVTSFCAALRHESGIQGLSAGSGMPIEGSALGTTTAWSGGKRREMMCHYFYIDPQFLPLLRISLAAGRNLSDSFTTDKLEAFLVNESFVRMMGWKNPIGQPMEGYDHKGKIVGVVKDFFYTSLHNTIEPAVLVYSSNPTIAALVKTTPQQLPRLGEIWKQFFPDRPFDYYFLDENFMEQYKKDKNTMFLFNAFTALAIFISCLGLYGLVALITIQRTKEIGIRKVLGASLLQLVTLQSKDQVLLIVWAALIAVPLAGIGGQHWLNSYAWHAQLSVWIFVWPVVVILLLALAVTGFQITRTAQANPVESLRIQ